jgi:hypothetical protein
MDTIKIDITGPGTDIAIESLTDSQINYILTHQYECNTLIPIINEANELTYINWRSANNEGDFYGLSLASDIKIKVNDIIQDYSLVATESDTFINDNTKKYLMSIEHLSNTTISYEINVDDFDITKLSIIIKNFDELYWGEIIYAIKYDDQTYFGNAIESNQYSFENIVITNDTSISIQKI